VLAQLAREVLLKPSGELLDLLVEKRRVEPRSTLLDPGSVVHRNRSFVVISPVG